MQQESGKKPSSYFSALNPLVHQQAPKQKVQFSLLWLFSAALFTSSAILFGLMAVVFVVHILRRYHTAIDQPRSMNILIFLFCLSGFMSYLLANNDAGNFDYLYLLLPATVILGAWIQPARQPLLPSWVFFAAILGTVAALAGVVNHFGGEPRTTGFFGGYFTLASLLAWSIPVSAGVLFAMGKQGFGIISAALLMQLAALWWTYTRSAFLGVALAIGIWAAIRIWRRLRHQEVFSAGEWRRWAIVAALPMLLVALSLTADDPRINPLATPPAGPAGTATDLSSGRGGIINDALNITQSRYESGDWLPLILGHGHKSRKRLVDSPFTSWESDFLQVFMDLGFFGLLILLAIYTIFLATCLRAIFSADPLRNGLAAAGLALFFMSFFTMKFASWHSAPLMLLGYYFLADASQSSH